MAWLDTLVVQGLRNIETACCGGFSRVNLFHGLNGAGKTTMLEAIYLLGMGRSFRSPRLGALIRHDSEELLVRCSLREQRTGRPSHGIGVLKRRSGEGRIQIDGSRCHAAAELAQILPLQLVDSETDLLVQGPPGLRRQFIDWGVFHVEHSFLAQWRRGVRLLKQRNSLLRRGKISLAEFDAWDGELALVAGAIDAMRCAYIERLLPALEGFLGDTWPAGNALSLGYYRGWDRQVDYAEVLQRSRQRDAELGYTQFGPHRADLRLKLGGYPVSQLLSRGQTKLLAIAMKLAQVALIRELSGGSCVVLVDDLSAELDARHRRRVLDELMALGCQVFMTAIDSRDLLEAGLDLSETAMFHVEHGAIKPS